MSAPLWLKRSRFLWSLFLRARLTAPARQLPAVLAAQGWSVRITADGIRLTAGLREVWVDHGDIYQLLAGFDRIANRIEYAVRDGRQVADLRGEARYLVPRTGDWIWQSQLVEPHAMAGYFARGEPAAGAIVFDAGAYCGEFSLIAARLVGPTGRVIAFEPDPINRKLLERNLRAAQVDNVVIYPGGLWERTGEVEFAVAGDYYSGVPAAGLKLAANTRVPMLSLPDAAQRFGRPDFVKMDIEGAELETIAGATGWLREQNVKFAIASYHVRDGQPTSTNLENLFRSIGYNVETGYPEHPTTWAWRG